MATQLHLANKVQYLRGIPFSQLTHNEKISIKTIGRPTPKLFIEQKSKARNGIYTRPFNDKVYDENDWICGCEEKMHFFVSLVYCLVRIKTHGLQMVLMTCII